MTSGPFSSGFFITTVYARVMSPMRATCPVYLLLGEVLPFTPLITIFSTSDVWGYFENLSRKLRKSGWNLTRITGAVLNISMNS
jgi:hypothetical protein